jgi:hypothetical protein
MCTQDILVMCLCNGHFSSAVSCPSPSFCRAHAANPPQYKPYTCTHNTTHMLTHVRTLSSLLLLLILLHRVTWSSRRSPGCHTWPPSRPCWTRRSAVQQQEPQPVCLATAALAVAQPPALPPGCCSQPVQRQQLRQAGRVVVSASVAAAASGACEY